MRDLRGPRASQNRKSAVSTGPRATTIVGAQLRMHVYPTHETSEFVNTQLPSSIEALGLLTLSLPPIGHGVRARRGAVSDNRSVGIATGGSSVGVWAHPLTARPA